MPWKTSGLVNERVRFAKEAFRAQQTMVQLCQQFGISRAVGYKWLRRFEAGGRGGLRDRSRRPKRSPSQLSERWRKRIRRARRRWRHWGAKKIARGLRRQHGSRGVPSERAIGKWLAHWKLSRRRRPRRRRAGTVIRPPLTQAGRANQVWTADFKGWFLTARGRRVEPLTVRDLYSRYTLAIRALPSPKWRPVQREFARLFRRHGLPQVIRTDHGQPFSSPGAAGLSQLSAWWTSLGIRVEFIAPGHPEQNGSHEHFHRQLKEQATQPPSTTMRAAQRRLHRWMRQYNHERPHQSLGLKTPAQMYRGSRRRGPQRAGTYPKNWLVRRVRRRGVIKWNGRLRFISEALIGRQIALRKAGPDQAAVYFCNVLLGSLHRSDAGGLRPTAYVRQHPPHAPPPRKVSVMSVPKV